LSRPHPVHGRIAPADSALDGKAAGVSVIQEQPLVAETRPEALDDDTTPVEKFFIRNNGKVPEVTRDPERWTLSVDGEVERALALTLGEIKAKFPHVKERMLLECGGNGRAFFTPTASGVQWHHGGAGCAEWTGVRLRDVLQAAGLKETARFTGHFGTDPTLEGDKLPISRGIPIGKALDENTLLVFAMNGEPLLPVHGFPLRLIVPGWVGSVSHKWLNRILIRKDRHDGAMMDPWAYRVPKNPVLPGDNIDPTTFVDLEAMPVRSVITSPAENETLVAGNTVVVRGAAWAGDQTIRLVEVSKDQGASWQRAELAPPQNAYDWTRFSAAFSLSAGTHELWSRATDGAGQVQPNDPEGWNPHGYGANPVHKITVQAG
jgi:DMSO/TMAO reductase YedYZ molybdopterin-dependent catalytic subunit